MQYQQEGMQKSWAELVHGRILMCTTAAVEWLQSFGSDGELVEFEYSNRRATYLGENLTVGGTVGSVDSEKGEVSLELFVKNEAGEVTTPGRATVRLGKERVQQR